MTFGELIRALGDDPSIGDVRDALLYKCQHCLRLINEHADDDKCLFGPTSFKGFPRSAVDRYAVYQGGHGTRRNLMRSQAT
jgi:hypothetical protein